MKKKIILCSSIVVGLLVGLGLLLSKTPNTVYWDKCVVTVPIDDLHQDILLHQWWHDLMDV